MATTPTLDRMQRAVIWADWQHIMGPIPFFSFVVFFKLDFPAILNFIIWSSRWRSAERTVITLCFWMSWQLSTPQPSALILLPASCYVNKSHDSSKNCDSLRINLFTVLATRRFVCSTPPNKEEIQGISGHLAFVQGHPPNASKRWSGFQNKRIIWGKIGCFTHFDQDVIKKTTMFFWCRSHGYKQEYNGCFHDKAFLGLVLPVLPPVPLVIPPYV